MIFFLCLRHHLCEPRPVSPFATNSVDPLPRPARIQHFLKAGDMMLKKGKFMGNFCRLRKFPEQGTLRGHFL